MSKIEVGSRVIQWNHPLYMGTKNRKITGRGTVTCIRDEYIHAVDDDGNGWHSYSENFELDPDYSMTNAENSMKDRLVPRQYPQGFPEKLKEPFVAPKPPIVIGLCGLKGSGKDTAAQALEGYENVKFAAPIKAMCRAFFEYIGMDPETIERVIDGDMKETPLACLGGKTCRYFQQVIGTEMGRVLIWDEIWINAAKMRCVQFEKSVVTDVRFVNEGKAIHDWKGFVIGINRASAENSGDLHPSEAEVKNVTCDVRIWNNGSISAFKDAVVSAVRGLLEKKWRGVR